MTPGLKPGNTGRAHDQRSDYQPLKPAFPEGSCQKNRDPCRITAETAGQDGQYALRVSDIGIGLPGGMEIEKQNHPASG